MTRRHLPKGPTYSLNRAADVPRVFVFSLRDAFFSISRFLLLLSDEGRTVMSIGLKPETEQRKDTLLDKSLKRVSAHSHTRRIGALTCSEALVDVILSEGEST